MKSSATVITLPPTTPHHQVVAELGVAIYESGGAICPTCSQHAQVYRWSLYSTAIRALTLFHTIGGTADFVHSNRLKELGHKGQGDAARLRLWGLVEREVEARADGGRSGYWRVTKLGEDFLRGRAKLPKYVYVYDGRLLRTEGPDVGIQDVLGISFDYAVMMQGAA